MDRRKVCESIAGQLLFGIDMQEWKEVNQVFEQKVDTFGEAYKFNQQYINGLAQSNATISGDLDQITLKMQQQVHINRYNKPHHFCMMVKTSSNNPTPS